MAIAAGCCVVAICIQGSTMAATGRFSLAWRLETSLASYVFYLGKLFYPADLAVLYPRVSLLPAWKVVTAALLLAGISAAAFHWRRRFPYLLVGWLWYLGMMVPVIGLLQIGVGNGANRFTYLPQIGLAIAVAWAWANVYQWWHKKAERGEGDCPDFCVSKNGTVPFHDTTVSLSAKFRTGPGEGSKESVAGHCGSPLISPLPAQFSRIPLLTCSAVTAALLVAMMACTWRETGHWRNSLSMWSHTLACTGPNHVAKTNYGAALAEAGQYEEAIAHFKKRCNFSPAPRWFTGTSATPTPP